MSILILTDIVITPVNNNFAEKAYQFVLFRYPKKTFLFKMRLIRKMKSDISLTIEPSEILAYPQPSFHQTFSFVIVFGQFFGIMPLHGIMTKDPQEIRFKWKSIRFFYAIYNVTGALIMGCFCIIKFALDGLMLDKTGI